MTHRVTVLPQKLHMDAPDGANLLALLRSHGLTVDAPCGGNGSCGKCRVTVDGQTVLACHTPVHRAMTVTLPQSHAPVPTQAASPMPGEDYALAFDIGTTTVAGFLLDGDGNELTAESALNPQVAFGADVVSRIRHAATGAQPALTDGIRRCADKLGRALCQKCGIFPQQVRTVSLVGNPAMQQLFLG